MINDQYEYKNEYLAIPKGSVEQKILVDTVFVWTSMYLITPVVNESQANISFHEAGESWSDIIKRITRTEHLKFGEWIAGERIQTRKEKS